MDSSPEPTDPSPAAPRKINLFLVIAVIAAFLGLAAWADSLLREFPPWARDLFQIGSWVGLGLFLWAVGWYVRDSEAVAELSPDPTDLETDSHAEFPHAPGDTMEPEEENVPFNPYTAPKFEERQPTPIDDHTAGWIIAAGVLGALAVGMLCLFLGPLLMPDLNFRLLVVVANGMSLAVLWVAWGQHRRRLAQRRLKASTKPPTSTRR